MNSYKHCCVVDAVGAYKTLVLILVEPDREGVPREVIQCYTLAEGERLIDTKPPATRIHTSTEGLVTPHWDFDSQVWTESATPEEITAWEQEHPAPTLPEAIPTPEQRISAIESAVLSLMEVQNV